MDQIAEEVKLALKPHFAKSLINKDEYKDIMRKTVPKVRRITTLVSQEGVVFKSSQIT